MSDNFKHILVVRLSALGDVAMTVPVLRALRQQYPNLRITVLTRERFAPIYRDIKDIDLLLVDLKGRHKGVLGLYRLSSEIKAKKIGAVADLHNVLRTKILKQFLFRTPFIQLDKGRTEKKALVSGKIFKPLKSMHQRYADVFLELGFALRLDNPIFPEPIQLNNDLSRFMGKHDVNWIGIAPFAAYPGKMYPLDAMEEVVSALSRDSQVILFGGGNKEVKYLDSLSSKYDNVMSIAGKFRLNEELDIMSNLDLMLSMDSGNAHLAAMLGVKVLTIWGVTHPFAGFAAFNQPKDHALLADREQYPLIPTSVYGNTCPESYIEASRTISPKEILAKIDAIIKKPYSEE